MRIQPWDTIAMKQYCHGILQPWDSTATGHYSHGTILSRDTTAMGQYCYGTLQPWDSTAMGHYSHGTVLLRDTIAMGQYCHGTLQPWESTAMGHYSHGTIRIKCVWCRCVRLNNPTGLCYIQVAIVMWPSLNDKDSGIDFCTVHMLHAEIVWYGVQYICCIQSWCVVVWWGVCVHCPGDELLATSCEVVHYWCLQTACVCVHACMHCVCAFVCVCVYVRPCECV